MRYHGRMSDTSATPTPLNDAERALAHHLLRMGASEFGRHGSNDFDLAEIIPDQSERDEFVRAYHEYNGDPEEYREQTPGRGDYRLPDFALFSFLAARVTGLA